MVSSQRRGTHYLIPVFIIFLVVVGGLLIAGFMLAPATGDNPSACTLEAKICPDGTSVGRSGPECTFDPCPALGASNVNGNTSTTNTSVPAGTVVRLTLYEAGTDRVIASQSLRLYVDNGTRCVTTPCPTNGRTWQSMTDVEGVTVIPAAYVDERMTITVPGYQVADLRQSGRQVLPGVWTLYLVPE